MSNMFDDFDNENPLDRNDFINKTTQSKGYDVSDSTQSKAISKTITINEETIKLSDDIQNNSRVDFSQMVRAGIMALHNMSKDDRDLLFDACYVPRNAGRKKK